MPGEEVIRLSSWSRDAEEYILEPADLGQVRSAAEPPGKALSPECEPRVALPASAFDFVALEAIRDHPAIHPLVRAELDLGVPFRVLRFPLALHSPERCRIAEAIYTVSLRSGGRRVPRVHSIFPERIEVHQEISAEISIEPTLKLGGALEIGACRIGRKIIAQQARSTIVGYWSEAGAECRSGPPIAMKGLKERGISWSSFAGKGPSRRCGLASLCPRR